MAQQPLQDVPTSLATSYRPSHTLSGKLPGRSFYDINNGHLSWQPPAPRTPAYESHGLNSTGKGIAIVYFFLYSGRGRILLDRMSRPGEYDDEQAFLREEEEAMAEMDDMQKAEYLRAKGEFVARSSSKDHH
jgi:hypothetical protein